MQYLLILLTIVFVICKIIGLIAWSWWLVFLPTIILIAIYIGILLVTLIIMNR